MTEKNLIASINQNVKSNRKEITMKRILNILGIFIGIMVLTLMVNGHGRWNVFLSDGDCSCGGFTSEKKVSEKFVDEGKHGPGAINFSSQLLEQHNRSIIEN